MRATACLLYASSSVCTAPGLAKSVTAELQPEITSFVMLCSLYKCSVCTLPAGFACTLGCWAPQLDDLLRAGEEGRPPVRVLVLDNRGVGRSSARLRRRAYSTVLMAQDIIAILVRLSTNIELEC